MSTAAIGSNVLQSLNGMQSAGKKNTADELRENFMTMLVTQLQNQDPLNPLQNTELTSHLAQINTVSGIDTLNQTLDGINAQIQAGRSLQAAALIGRGVLVPGDRMLVGEEGVSTPFGVELGQPVATLNARIVGSDGQIIHSIQLTEVDAGVESIGWDGKLESGEFAAPGAYRVEIEALDSEGEPVQVTALNYAIVSGISSDEGGTLLDLGGIAEPVTLDEVRQIL